MTTPEELDALHETVRHMTRRELEALVDMLDAEYQRIVQRDNGSKLSPEATTLYAKMSVVEQQIDFLGTDDGPEIKPQAQPKKPFVI